MSVELKKMVAGQFSPRLSAIGFAPVDRFVDARKNITLPIPAKMRKR